MDNNTHNNDFLARWISGELSEAEKVAFEKTKEFQAYQAILNGTDLLDVPKLDKERFFEKLQQQKKSKPRERHSTVIPKWSYLIAASVTLLMGYFLFFNNNVSYSTGFGEQIAIILPDNSKVVLNAKSKLTYNKKDWESKRTLDLEGEAYFKVAKGKTFTVKTINGNVEVIGTQFTVNSEETIFEVICYKGTVNVTYNETSRILTHGRAVRLMENKLEDWQLTVAEPTWLQQKSTFNNTPLIQVIITLEKQYNISIDDSNIDTDKLRYTGGFTHINLDKALQSVFVPLKINFTFIQKNRIVLSDNR